MWILKQNKRKKEKTSIWFQRRIRIESKSQIEKSIMSSSAFVNHVDAFFRQQIDAVVSILATKYGFDLNEAKEIITTTYFGGQVVVPTPRSTKSKKTSRASFSSSSSSSSSPKISGVIDTIMNDSELNEFQKTNATAVDVNTADVNTVDEDGRDEDGRDEDGREDHVVAFADILAKEDQPKPKKRAKLMSAEEKQAVLDAKEKLKIEREEAKAKEKADKEAAKALLKSEKEKAKAQAKTAAAAASIKKKVTPKGSKPVELGELDDLASVSSSMADHLAQNAFRAIEQSSEKNTTTTTGCPLQSDASNDPAPLEPLVKKVTRITINGIRYLMTAENYLYFEETKEDAFLRYHEDTKTTSYSCADDMNEEDYISSSQCEENFGPQTEATFEIEF